MKQAIRILSTAIFFIGILQGCSKSNGDSTTPTNKATVTTIAGNGISGFVDGTDSIAEFGSPWGVAIDNQGNVYVADETNNCIRKISSSGVVSTFAGNGTPGYADGIGTAAEIYGPNDLTTDAQGNLYVSDESGERIRKVTPQGVVTTVAGNGILGEENGAAANAEFNAPSSVAIDAQGNIYVTDQFNNLIRKISSTGVVTTFAGDGNPGFADGTGTNSEFNSPNGIAVDAQGNVYVSDRLNFRVRKITPAGVVTTVAGNGTAGYVDATGTSAEFYGALGLAIDANNNLYVGDYGNNVVRKITPAGVVSTLAGNGTAGYIDGVAANAEFIHPWGVAVDAQGNVYVADSGNKRIRKITQN